MNIPTLAGNFNTLFTVRQRAVVSVINDLVTDNRVIRTCGALREAGFDVLLVGRRLRDSPDLPGWPFAAKRMRLLFNKGPLFYFFFNLRLFFLLLRTRAQLLYANDLDTLLPNYLVSRIKAVPLIYDSHELFCDVPELQETPLKRAIWRSIERFLVPRVRHRITVNKSIADIFRRRYGVVFDVVRNIADHDPAAKPKTRAELGLPAEKKIVLLQGAGININRGAEELVDAMKEVDGALLLIIGAGDVWESLLAKSLDAKLQGRIRMTGRVPAAELRHYTLNADIGVSIDKPGNPNYDNSLPNKVFDYIQAGVPVLASRLPEVERVLSQTRTGVFISSHDPSHIAATLREALSDDRLPALKQRAAAARQTFSWSAEKQTLLRVVAGAAGKGR